MTAHQILVVEDEAIVAEDIASRLESLGYGVVDIVASGEAAVRSVAEQIPDLILMDIMLRGSLDGIDAAHRIRAEFSVPIIYLTANADESTLQRAKATEPFGYLLKPFKEKELRAAIEIALARHQAQAEVQQALAQAEIERQQALQISAFKSQFLAMASHELRSPLSVIKIATEILQHYDRQLSDDAKLRHFERIELAMETLDQLLNDVLTLEQTEAGPLVGSFSPVEVVGFCRNLVESYQWSAPSSCTIRFSTACDRLDVCLDAKLLWHLLNNLVSNAVKYSPAGGTVWLRVFQRGSFVCLEVQDEGIGIPPDAQLQLFEPFRRANNVGSIPGTGLGLAIAKRAVDLHSGEIAVSSTLGEGSTFTVKLPLQPPVL